MRDFRGRLQDILDAIGQIEAEQGKGKATFDGSPLIQVWMVHHLMITACHGKCHGWPIQETQ